MTMLQDAVALMARLMLAFIFIYEAWFKIANHDATLAYMNDHGVSGTLLPLAIVTELGGGLLIACGFLSRIAASILAGFCLLTALLFHTDFGNVDQLIHFQKNVAIAGGFLALAAFGAGSWSIDALRARLVPRRSSTTSATGHLGTGHSG
jgi:putative oxidoreductase